MGLAESLAKGYKPSRPEAPTDDDDDMGMGTYDDDTLSQAQDTLEQEFSPDQASAVLRAIKLCCSAMKK